MKFLGEYKFNKIIYPFSNIAYDRRNEADFKEAKVQEGIYSETTLANHISLPDAIPFDYMHLVFLGICKKILSHWFSSTNTNEYYYLGKSKAIK